MLKLIKKLTWKKLTSYICFLLKNSIALTTMLYLLLVLLLLKSTVKFHHTNRFLQRYFAFTHVPSAVYTPGHACTYLNGTRCLQYRYTNEPYPSVGASPSPGHAAYNLHQFHTEKKKITNNAVCAGTRIYLCWSAVWALKRVCKTKIEHKHK